MVVESSRVRAAVLAALAAVSVGAPAEDLSQLDLRELMQMDITLVMAQKRVENVDRVPISMTVIKRDAIRAGALNSTEDLQFFAPGMTTLGGANLITPYIRGVGTDVASSGIEPSVATYVDGVYQGDRAQTWVDLADAEQVEILRGPQGTLYGRNATGGAINIRTRGPTDTFIVETEAAAGNLNLRDANLFLAGPLADALKVSFSAHARERDGAIENIATGENVNDENIYSLHGRAQIELTSALQAELLLKYFNRDNSGAYASEISGNSLPALLGFDVSTDSRQIASDATDLENDIDYSTIALKLNWSAPWANVQSISSRQEQRHEFSADFDASTAPLATYVVHDEYSAFTQEFQFSPAHKRERWDWLFGAFYLNSTASMSPVAISTAIPEVGVVTQLVTGEIATEAYAAFGEATYALTSALSITGGLRFSHEQQHLDDVAAGVQGLPLMRFPAHDGDWDAMSYRVIAKYTLDDAFFYAKTESGFKSGAFNNGNVLYPGPIDPERITAYEIGVKSMLPGSGVRVSAAAFYYDYRDLQLQIFASDGSRLAQASKADIYGAEAAADWQVTQRWSINAGASWTHATYREFTSDDLLAPSPYGGNALTPNQSLADNHLLRTPELAGNLGVSYAHPLPSGELVGSTNYYRSSRVYFYPTDDYSQAPYGLLNASLQYRSEAGWHVSLWGKNLGGADYFMMVVPSQLGTAAEYGLPRTYGVSFGYKFAD